MRERREKNLNLMLKEQFSIISVNSKEEISVNVNDLNKIVGRQTKKSICLPTLHIDFESAFCSSQYLLSNFTNRLAYFLMKYQEKISLKLLRFLKRIKIGRKNETKIEKK